MLSALLADNDLADAFALCFDDTSAAFSDGDGTEASSIDLGGPDPRKYTGSMQYLQMLNSDGYYVSPPQHIFVGGNMNAAMDAAASIAEEAFKRVVIDSGTASTLSLPRTVERALAGTGTARTAGRCGGALIGRGVSALSEHPMGGRAGQRLCCEPVPVGLPVCGYACQEALRGGCQR